ncbi:MAG: 4-alpha-glucanotransferase [Luteimonas sp.]
MTSLHALAATAGLQRDWVDADGASRTVDDAALHAILDAMHIPAHDAARMRDSRRAIEASRSRTRVRTAQAGAEVWIGAVRGGALELVHEDGAGIVLRVDDAGIVRAPSRPGDWQYTLRGTAHWLVVAPARCYGIVDALDVAAPRAWGVGLQVYATRAPGDPGVGTATGVADWVPRVAQHGGDAIALSPVHASRPHAGHYSPYAPSDRRFLDPVYAAPARVLGAATVARAYADAGLAGREALDAADLIDWAAATDLAQRRLRALHAAFDGCPDVLRQDHAAFVADGGAALASYADHAARDRGDGDSRHAIFAQWLVDRSWRTVQQDARDRGMGIGLIADIAVGFDPDGAEAAAWPDAVLSGLELGAPPDAFNDQGQTWGVTGYSPAGLEASGYAPFRALLRATMRGRGGVRIDHILGLMRLWVVPRGASPADGAYLACPLHDLLNLVALESWRQRCIVIGEDLGVVPDGIRAVLAQRGVLGIDVLPFTRDREGSFLAPAQWRREAIATTTTHDLPTLAGWAAARDIDWRERLAGEPSGFRAAARNQRAADVAALDATCASALGIQGVEAWSAFVAASASPLALLPAEDALGLMEQPNLPGTVDGHPNWRRRLPAEAGALDARLTAFDRAREIAA